MNGNRGARQEICFNGNVSEEILPFQQEFPTWECDVKMIQLDFRSRSRTKKSASDS